MKNFSTWLLVMFMAMFWAFRVIVAVMPEFGTTLGDIVPLNSQWEIALSFVVLGCMILIVKRKLVGALIYAGAYGMYFGVDLVKNVSAILKESLSEVNMINALISFIAIVLAFGVLLDMLIDKGRKANPKDKKTDWFYNNKKFDRELDDRADKNNYRTL